jgi:hypothetical protein
VLAKGRHGGRDVPVGLGQMVTPPAGSRAIWVKQFLIAQVWDAATGRELLVSPPEGVLRMTLLYIGLTPQRQGLVSAPTGQREFPVFLGFRACYDACHERA